MPGIFTELKRRNVFRVAIAYTIVAWVVAQVFDLAVDNFGAPDWVMKVILAILVAGLPVALVLAWAFELTPDGVRKTEDVPVAESITPNTGRKLNYITTAALVLALAFIAWDKLGPDADTAGSAITDKSVAVLPFADLSQEQDQEWFADGLTEEILNSLARLPELQVTARTSSFEYKNTNADIREFARRLGVANVVEGSVRRIGENLRITAQLIRADDGFHLWSDTYNRTTEDLFDVQNDVAENIAAALDVILDDDKRGLMFATGTRNVAAFEAYSKGRDLFGRAHERLANSPVSLTDANVYFERAMELDPKFAVPAILHSDRYAHRLMDGKLPIVGDAENLDADTALRQLRRDIDFAIENAPDEISRIIAQINRELFSPHWHRMPALVDQFKRAMSEDSQPPRDGVWLDEVLLLVGELELVERLAEQRTKEDPLSRNAWLDFVKVRIRQGEFDDALAKLEQARRNLGDTRQFREIEITTALLLDDRQTAIEALEDDFDFSGAYAYLQSLLAILKGDTATAIRIGEENERARGLPDAPMLIVFHEMGDQIRANELAAQIDDLAVGPAMLALTLAWYGGDLWFDLEHTPNLNKRLEEAQIDTSWFRPPQWPDAANSE